jgi:hypothetical protein
MSGCWATSKVVLRQLIRFRNVLIRQYPRPCNRKLGFAVVEVNAVAVAAVAIRRRVIVPAAALSPGNDVVVHSQVAPISHDFFFA